MEIEPMNMQPERTTFPEGHRLAGKPAWFFPESKRFVPVVSGAEGETDPPTPPPPPGNPPPPAGGGNPPPPPEPKTLTQEEVNGLVARERAAAEKRYADSLGMSLEDAKALIARQKDAEKAAMTEAERAKTEAAEAAAAAKADRDAAKADRHAAAVERALTSAGVRDDRLDKAMRLLDVEVGADADALKGAVAALKKDTPEFFGTESGKGPNGRAPSSSPSGTPPRPKPETDAYAASFERGRSAARPRRNPGVEARGGQPDANVPGSTTPAGRR